MTRDEDVVELAGDVDDDGTGDSMVCVRLRFCLTGTAETSGYIQKEYIPFVIISFGFRFGLSGITNQNFQDVKPLNMTYLR